jgi:putative transposase
MSDVPDQKRSRFALVSLVVGSMVGAGILKRLRSLEEENAKLKRLLADTILDNAALNGLLAKKW